MWPESISQAASQVLGVLLVLFALRLVFKEQVVVNEAGDIVDVSVAGWRFRTRSSALAVMAIGVLFFFGPPLVNKWLSPPTLRASGRILLHDGQKVDGLPGATIGVLPTGYTTGTTADGTYSFDFPKGKDGEIYQAAVHVSNTDPPLFVLGIVRFNQGSREGTFDYTFHRSRK